METGNIILDKLDDFIRKYYKNKLIRGILWTITILAVAYITLVLPEYFFRFDIPVRAFAFFAFMSIAGFLAVRLILIPFLQFRKIGRNISYEQAAKIIGDHFPEIQDKLLNTLQLMNLDKWDGESLELVKAGIGQKTDSMRVFKFSGVIDLKKNIKYLRFAAVPIALILLLALIYPETISGPTRRIVRFDSTFAEELPYRLKILNSSLTAIQQEDFELKVLLTGSEIPRDIYITIGKSTFKMIKNENFTYSYLFRSVQSDVDFRIVAGDLNSGKMTLTVVPRPVILSFEVEVVYPEYTQKKNETLENQGDLTVPEGSKVKWRFNTKDVEKLTMAIDSVLIAVTQDSKSIFSTNQQVFRSGNYSIIPSNSKAGIYDSLSYRINVIADGFPSIFVNEVTDTVMDGRLFFRGTIKDDYGFSGLSFKYAVFESGSDTSSVKVGDMSIDIEHRMNNQVFFFSEDVGKLIERAGQSINYWFEVSDNDGIHGPKKAKSEVRLIKTLSVTEIEELTRTNAEQMENEMQHSIEKTSSINKNIDELNRKMVENKNISWQDKKKLDDLIKDSKDIEKRIEEAKRRNSENIRNEKEFLETNERIMEKQEKLNEILDQLMTEELKKMLEEMKQMMDNLDKDKLSDMLEKMKLSTRDLEKQLDRSLELMKQLEYDRKLDEITRDLKKTSDEQNELAKKSDSLGTDAGKLAALQEKLNQKSDSLLKEVNKLKEEGKKLEEPSDLGNTEGMSNSIKKNQEEGLKNLKESNKKGASGKQKKAAEEMKQLAEQMESSREEEESEQMEEDAENLRKILEDLVRLSFTQEDLINRTKAINRNDPRYTEMVYRQKEFGEKIKVVEDSLHAIAKRQIMIQPIVSREIALINQNVDMTLEALEIRNTGQAVAKQQYTMTSVNNLALLLNESMEKMNQESMSMKSKSGNKSCSNPSSGKKGKTSAKSMKELQDQLGKQLEKMKAGLEEAKKKGEKGREGSMGMNRELAKLAAQQEALRNSLRKYQEELGEKGIKDQSGLNEAAKAMEQIERDLVNKQITQETIKRQQQILTRLLESEKAEQTREKEEKRESREAKEIKIGNPSGDFKYKTLKRGGFDDIQLSLPVMTTFYKNKVNSYIVKIGF